MAVVMALSKIKTIQRERDSLYSMASLEILSTFNCYVGALRFKTTFQNVKRNAEYL